VAVGANGLMVEVHDRPTEALSDANQAITPDQFETLVGVVRSLAPVVGRRLAGLSAARR
jgi:3-deoxy-7-phosphoheptulonate synthase